MAAAEKVPAAEVDADGVCVVAGVADAVAHEDVVALREELVLVEAEGVREPIKETEVVALLHELADAVAQTVAVDDELAVEEGVDETVDEGEGDAEMEAVALVTTEPVASPVTLTDELEVAVTRADPVDVTEGDGGAEKEARGDSVAVAVAVDDGTDVSVTTEAVAVEDGTDVSVTMEAVAVADGAGDCEGSYGEAEETAVNDDAADLLFSVDAEDNADEEDVSSGVTDSVDVTAIENDMTAVVDAVGNAGAVGDAVMAGLLDGMSECVETEEGSDDGVDSCVEAAVGVAKELTAGVAEVRGESVAHELTRGDCVVAAVAADVALAEGL